jgi:hypothetical protein
MKRILITTVLLCGLLFSGCSYANTQGYTKCIVTDYSGKSIEYSIKDYIIGDGDKIKLYFNDGSSMDLCGHYRFEK